MTRTFENKFVMLVQLAIKPDQLEAFLDYTADNLSLSRSAAGNIVFDILIDEAHPNLVRFYEVWESAEAQQSYMAWRIGRGDLATLVTFLDGEPTYAAFLCLAN